MYLRLLYYANGARYKSSGGEWVFRKWVAVPSKELLRDVGIPRMSMYKIRDELVKAGYIRFKPGIGNGATEYMLVSLAGNSNSQEATQKAPQTKPSGAAAQGSFDTDDFFAAAVRKNFGEEF